MDSPQEEGHNPQPTQALSPTIGASSTDESFTSNNHDICNSRGHVQTAAAMCASGAVSLYYITLATPAMVRG